MERMRRNAKWIALAVVAAMVTPFLAQGVSALLAVNPGMVSIALLAVIFVVLLSLMWSSDDGEERDR
jgi:hypothetical protein